MKQCPAQPNKPQTSFETMSGTAEQASFLSEKKMKKEIWTILLFTVVASIFVFAQEEAVPAVSAPQLQYVVNYDKAWLGPTLSKVVADFKAANPDIDVSSLDKVDLSKNTVVMTSDQKKALDNVVHRYNLNNPSSKLKEKITSTTQVKSKDGKWVDATQKDGKWVDKKGNEIEPLFEVSFLPGSLDGESCGGCSCA